MTSFGKVIGRFRTQVIDSADPDSDPDIVPLTGTIEFRLNVDKIIDSSVTPPEVLATSTIIGVLDVDGHLSTPDPSNSSSVLYQGLYLPPTDDPNYNPGTNLAYTVTYKLKDPTGKLVTLATHTMAVPGGTTVNLPEVVPPSGAPVIGVAAAEAAAALAADKAATSLYTAEISGSDLILTDYNGRQVNAGSVTAATAGAVTSVNGEVGDVILTSTDVGASPSGAYVKPIGGIPKMDLDSAVQASLDKADTALQTVPVGGGGAALTQVPPVGYWCADPLTTNYGGGSGKTLWYKDSYMVLGYELAIDRIAIKVTTANTTNTTLTVTMYPLNADGTIDTTTTLATGTLDVSTTGEKDLVVSATIPLGGVAFRFSGPAATSPTGVSSGKKLGMGANMGNVPSWDQEPYPIGSNSLSYWQPIVYVRRAS